MSDEQNVLPVLEDRGQELDGARGVRPRELELKPPDGIRQLNERGKALKWQIVRKGNDISPRRMIADNFFSNRIWDPHRGQDVTIVPPLMSEHVFMVLQDDVRELCPDSGKKKRNTPTEMRKAAVKDTFEETGRPGRGGVNIAAVLQEGQNQIAEECVVGK